MTRRTIARRFGDRERERLIKLFRALGTDNTHEAEAARGRIDSLLREFSKNWADLIQLLGGTIHADLARNIVALGSRATVDGFRSSFSRWAHEQTAHSNHVIEMTLAHAVGSDVEKVYRRTDLFNKRRKLMEQWAAYCCSPPAAAGAVLPMRKGASA